MKICEYCNIVIEKNYGSGRFCSEKCARGFSTKSKRKEINEKTKKTFLHKYGKIIETRICLVCETSFEVISSSKKKCCSIKCGSRYGGRLGKNKTNGEHTSQIILICKECNLPFTVDWRKRGQQFCSNNCRHKNKDYLKSISETSKKRCSSLLERKRLRDIGRKGGFGKRGKTKNGTNYSSNLEKQCFEWLEENNVKFYPHKYLPNSSKVSDIFLINEDLWIELDGINREKKKKWLGKDYEYWLNKLEIYKENNLNYKIIYNLNELKKLFKFE
jgi:hypothetical protein